MVNPEIIAIAHTRHASQEGSLPEVGGSNVCSFREATKVAPVDANDEQNATREEKGRNQILRLFELAPVERIETRVPVCCVLGKCRGRRGYELIVFFVDVVTVRWIVSILWI
jgi:hypothetical protein